MPLDFDTAAQLILGRQMGELMLRVLGAQAQPAIEAIQKMPNILFCLSDDQSYPHASRLVKILERAL